MPHTLLSSCYVLCFLILAETYVGDGITSFLADEKESLSCTQVVNTHRLSDKPEFRPKSDSRAFSSRAQIQIPAWAARSQDGHEMVLSGGVTISGGVGGSAAPATVAVVGI